MQYTIYIYIYIYIYTHIYIQYTYIFVYIQYKFLTRGIEMHSPIQIWGQNRGSSCSKI